MCFSTGYARVGVGRGGRVLFVCLFVCLFFAGDDLH